MDVPGVPDFDDEPTVIEVREEDIHGSRPRAALCVLGEEPPPLPFTLRRARPRGEHDWLDALPEAARRILEAAREPAGSWPRADRVPGAVAIPLHPIPSLSRHA